MRIVGYIAFAGVVSVLAGATPNEHRPAIQAAGRVPLSFERVTSGNEHWMARGNGYSVSIGAADVEVGLNREQLRIQFVGADAQAASVGLEALPGKVNFLIGSDPKAWRRDVATYQRVRYQDVYPGVDAVWYGKQGQLEYDLEIHPGAETGRIAMRFEGARRLSLDSAGDLRVELAGGWLSLKLPVVYQVDGRGRRRIGGGYELRDGNEVRFHLDDYDKTRPLVIDPTLVYATYFGSNSPTVDAVAVDGSGNIYMAGYTNDNLIPTANAVQSGTLGQTNAFVTKFDPTGQTILYSTYLGGSQVDTLQGIAVDSNGNLVGTGQTTSPDFPLVNAAQLTFGSFESAFAFRLNAAGNALVYSTYLGGYGSSSGYAAAFDANGNAYVTGYADSLQGSAGALNNCCAFVAKLSNTGSQIYTALIGADVGRAIAVDAQGAAYVAGYSTAGSFANNPPGARTTNAGDGDAFAAKLSPDASSLVWATFLGGSGSDSANAIALGAGGVVYFAGQTSSPDLPVTAGVVQSAYGGGGDGFVASLKADGLSFGFVTYFGGAKSDNVASIALASNGLISAGNTTSHDFPIASALQPAFPASPYAFLKSTNSGASFTGGDNGLPYYSGFLLPDPTSSGTLLLDTGQGIFRSTDDGVTWTNVEPNSNGSTVRSLSNPSVIYTAAGCNLYKSIDAGQTWNATYTNSAPCATVIAISPSDPNTVMLFDGYAEYRSADGGITFSSAITIPMSLAYGGNSVASRDGSVYVVARFSGLFKSSDAGLTWIQLGTGKLPAELRGFAVSPSNPSILYAADGANVYKSTNAGALWTTVGKGAALDYLAVDPSNAQRIYGSSYSGILLVSSDGGANWAPSGAPLDCYFVLSLAVNPTNPAEVYVTNYVPQSGFISKLSTDGTKLLWSTYYGPYDNSQVGGVATAPSGDAWVAGTASSGSLPLTPNARNGNTYALGPAFLARIADATASCSYTINPATQYVYSAGRLAFTVTAPSGCAWTATPSDSWIHLIRTSGTGSGTIPLAVDQNTLANTRAGTVSLNGQIYTIVQPSSSCTYQLSYPSLTSAGGTATIAVTAPTGCPWDVELANSDPAAITSSSTGIGNGAATVSIPSSTSVESLFLAVRIGNSYTEISDASACLYSFPNGTTITIPLAALRYSIQVNTNLEACPWNAYTDQPSWLALGDPNPEGSGSLIYTVTQNTTGVDRIAHIVAGGQQLTITQTSHTTAEFADVPESATFFDAANLMFDAGVTNGCQASNDAATRLFCPNNNITRGEMAAFLVRSVTGTLTPALYNPAPYFTDVPTTNGFFPFIQKLEELGITNGCGAGLFCPTETIPRWEMAIFMVRSRLALHGAPFTTAKIPYFTDVPTNVEGNGVPFPFIQRAYEEHVTNGCGVNPLIYCPDELVTRGQMASFIMRGLFNETTILGPTAPQVTGVSPSAMASIVGTQIAVIITGANTSFQTGDTVSVPSGMLAVTNVAVNSATSITATLTANSNVVAGPQALVVTSGGQNLTLPMAIQVGTY